MWFIAEHLSFIHSFTSNKEKKIAPKIAANIALLPQYIYIYIYIYIPFDNISMEIGKTILSAPYTTLSPRPCRETCILSKAADFCSLK